MEKEISHTRLRGNQNIANPLGACIEEIRLSRGIPIKVLGEKIGLPGITPLRLRPSEEVSLYAIEKVLQASETLELNDSEQNALADAVESVISTTLEKKGYLYDRLPPVIPKIISKKLDCVTYNDTGFIKEQFNEKVNEKEVNNIAQKFRKVRLEFGIPPVFDDKQAMIILDEVKRRSEVRNERKKVKSDFGKFMIENGVSEELLSEFKSLREDSGVPRTREFSQLLQKFEESKISPDIIEQIVNVWVSAFQKNLPFTSVKLQNEFGISRQRISQLANKLDPENKLSNWEKIEAVRAWRNEGTNSVSFIAKEFRISANLAGYYAKRLKIQDTKNLSDDEVSKLKKVFDKSIRRRQIKASS